MFNVGIIRSCDNCGKNKPNPDDCLCEDCKPERFRYVVARIHVLERPHIERGGELKYEWVPVFEYGTHNSNVNAKRALLKGMGEIGSKYVSDSHVKGMFKQFQNMKHYKILRIKTKR